MSFPNITEVVEETTEGNEEAPSPFIPGTNIQYAWDATSLGYLKRCPQLYKYKMIDGYRSKKENIHLRWGQEMHTAFHQYVLLRMDMDHNEAVFHVIRDLLYRIEDWDIPDHKTKTKSSLIVTIIRYLDKHKDDPASTIKLSNGKPAVEVSFTFELDYGPAEGQPYVLCGHLDRVVSFNDEIFFEDYKSTTFDVMRPEYFNHYHPDNQMSLYTVAVKDVFQTAVRGGIINAGQVKKDDTVFNRGITYRTDAELEEWLEDLHHWLDLAKHYAEIGHWPKNDTACHMYSGCEYRGICSKSPAVRQKFLDSEFEKKPWNPLEIR